MATAEMCFGEKVLEGAELVTSLSQALRGDAAAWLVTVCHPGMTWTSFKVSFLDRFDSNETFAGTLITLSKTFEL